MWVCLNIGRLYYISIQWLVDSGVSSIVINVRQPLWRFRPDGRSTGLKAATSCISLKIRMVVWFTKVCWPWKPQMQNSRIPFQSFHIGGRVYHISSIYVIKINKALFGWYISIYILHGHGFIFALRHGSSRVPPVDDKPLLKLPSTAEVLCPRGPGTI